MNLNFLKTAGIAISLAFAMNNAAQADKSPLPGPLIVQYTAGVHKLIMRVDIYKNSKYQNTRNFTLADNHTYVLKPSDPSISYIGILQWDCKKVFHIFDAKYCKNKSLTAGCYTVSFYGKRSKGPVVIQKSCPRTGLKKK